MSVWHKATVAANSAVEAPTTATTFSASGAYSNKGDSRATMNTPAVTMVAAWIRADTGVGPSIASGSQVCRPSCADLPIAPMNSRMHSTSIVCTVKPRKPIVAPLIPGAAARISVIETVSNTR